MLNGKIYISGGCFGVGCAYSGYSSMLYMYDPVANTWTPKQRMPEGGDQGVTGVFHNKLYALSNCYEPPPSTNWYDNCDHPLQNFFRYNPATDRWIVLPSPTNMYSVGGMVDGRLYVTDGANVEVYDPTTNQWTKKRQGPQRRIDAAGAVLGGQLYLTGGRRLTPDVGWQPLRTTDIYHPLTDTWSTGASLPTDRVGSAGARVFVNGQARFEVVGGKRPGTTRRIAPNPPHGPQGARL